MGRFAKMHISALIATLFLVACSSQSIDSVLETGPTSIETVYHGYGEYTFTWNQTIEMGIEYKVCPVSGTPSQYGDSCRSGLALSHLKLQISASIYQEIGPLYPLDALKLSLESSFYTLASDPEQYLRENMIEGQFVYYYLVEGDGADLAKDHTFYARVTSYEVIKSRVRQIDPSSITRSEDGNVAFVEGKEIASDITLYNKRGSPKKLRESAPETLYESKSATGNVAYFSFDPLTYDWDR